MEPEEVQREVIRRRLRHDDVARAGRRVAMEVKVGDKILFGKYSGSETKVGGDEYLIMRESEILAILA